MAGVAADLAVKEKAKAALAAWIAADEAERVRQRTGWRGLRRRVRSTWRAARLRWRLRGNEAAAQIEEQES